MDAKAKYLAQMYGTKKKKKEKVYKSANLVIDSGVVEQKEDEDEDEAISRAGLYILSKAKRKAAVEKESDPRPLEETVHRDKFGRKIDMNLLIEQKQAVDKAKDDETAERLRVGRGLKQQEQEVAMKERLASEKNSKFAYFKDDEEHNEKLKEIERFDDPMAKVKKGKKDKPAGYQGAWAPNRFGIPPGKDWDGVDRGNGFEVRLYQAKNMRKVKDESAYAWSTEDM